MVSIQNSESPPHGDTALQRRVIEISQMELDASILALVDLIPRLIACVSTDGQRLIQHPDYEGLGDLDTVGRLYLSFAHRCTSENASFDTRLLHVSVESAIYDLYCASEHALTCGIKGGTVARSPNNRPGCACCRGDPDAVILCRSHEGEALFFEESEYSLLWGNERSSGLRIGQDGSFLMASGKQLEEAKRRKAENRAHAML